ncbi:MAG: DNA-binding response regulator, partial [Acidobacteria bacterium]
LVARAIHTHSPRSGAPFVTVNSGSMPADLLESNLFGHVRGAFTGAVANKKGLFEVAEGGSIFLDEIGTVGLETQAKLLRVIQEKEFMRLGSVETQKADVRIIAATNVDLKKMVGEGRFREDLYYRLCVITIPIPPLRDRREDIPLLADHFVRLYASENDKPISGLEPETMKALLDYD